MFERFHRIVNTSSYYDNLFLRKALGSWHGSVLDVGCGSKRLRAHLPFDVAYTGIDAAGSPDVRVDIAKETYPFPDESFDFVLCNAVLEHVADPEHVMREIVRVLKKGGRAYVSVPFLQPYHPDPEDYRRFTHHGLVQFVERFGFKVRGGQEAYGTSLVIEYLSFFELIQFVKHPLRFLNPLRYFHLAFIIPVYLLAKLFNSTMNPFLQRDRYASPGASVIAEKA